MSTRNWNLGRLGLAVAALAALSVTACDPYMKANTSTPVVIGVLVADVNANEAVPPGVAADGCFVPYPEPNLAWAQSNFPGLCDPTYVDRGLPTICPTRCYPPRTGAAFAPFYMGNMGGSYLTESGSTYVYSVPANAKYVVQRAPPGAAPGAASDFTFAQIRVLFNKLMDPKSIQPNPYDAGRCIPAGGADGPKVYKQQPALAPGIGTEVTETELWSICYDPNSATDYWGASLTATPDAGELEPDTKYTVLATVQDQQGVSATVDVTVLTDALVVTPVAAK